MVVANLCITDAFKEYLKNEMNIQRLSKKAINSEKAQMLIVRYWRKHYSKPNDLVKSYPNEIIWGKGSIALKWCASNCF